MKDDTISRKAALDALEKSKKIYFDRQVIIGAMKGIVKSLPSAQPDEEKISDSLYEVYRLTCSQLGTGGVSVLKYYIAEIWREIYGEEGPKWLKK